MSQSNPSHATISFAPEALERCFAVAQVLAEVYDRPEVEYGLVGLAAQSRPFHVLATPLLAGQEVGAASVHQPGCQVLSMRREISALSEGLGLTLVPIAFIHRHPHGCTPSAIDDEFLAGPFIDQVSTVVSFRESTTINPGHSHYGCLSRRALSQPAPVPKADDARLEVEWSVAFSLIVNGRRDHHLYAVRKERCPYCTEGSTRFVAAELAVSPDRALPPQERRRIREELVSEIAVKVRFCREMAPAEVGS
ncbi:MAG: hypothetical protein HY763_10605 [Planctomycetes bacterium]|nr:hypothetical protein [Planctomycetota bacterium]